MNNVIQEARFIVAEKTIAAQQWQIRGLQAQLTMRDARGAVAVFARDYPLSTGLMVIAAFWLVWYYCYSLIEKKKDRK